MPISPEMEHRLPFVWQTNNPELMAKALVEYRLIGLVTPMAGGTFFKARLFSYDTFANFPIGPESLAPLMPAIVKKLFAVTPHQFDLSADATFDVEIGIYSPTDIRVWRVRRGI